MEEKIINRVTSWYVINVKARRNQTPNHYVNAWKAIREKDPLVEIPHTANRMVSVKRILFSNDIDENGTPTWIMTNLVAYTIINPNEFYNRRTKEKLQMKWDDDIAANMKETELFFIPSVHKIAVRKSSDITLNYLLHYLQNALDSIEPECFDIDVVKDHDELEKILTAHSILSIEAEVSYSNPGNTGGFQEIFEEKARSSNLSSLWIRIRGSKDHPLNTENDGLVKAIVSLSEENGSVKAIINQTETSGPEVIDTKQHPFILRIPQMINNYCTTIYNEFRTRYGNNQ